MFLVKSSPGGFLKNLDFYFTYIIFNPGIKNFTQEMSEFFRRNRIATHSCGRIAIRYDKRKESNKFCSHFFEKVINNKRMFNIFSIHNTEYFRDYAIVL